MNRLNWSIGDQRLSLTRDGHLVADLRLTPSQAKVLGEALLDFAGERYSAVRSRGAKVSDYIERLLDKIVELQRENAGLRQRVAELERDRERLDKLERLHDAGPWPDTDEFDDGQVVRVWVVTRKGEHRPYGTLREAIDAARKEGK